MFLHVYKVVKNDACIYFLLYLQRYLQYEKYENKVTNFIFNDSIFYGLQRTTAPILF